ncbi:MAG: hypothetical protein EBT21_04455 [Actinobacteria bacterium]|nr:hypothetical protein [Actinomycetota bacterium]
MEMPESLRDAFYRERNVPYKIPLSTTEQDDCCSGKHARLLREWALSGVEIRQRVCWFRWSDLALPDEVAKIPHDDCTHVFLEANVDGDWKVVDATWDPGLAAALPINEWNASMAIAVPPTRLLSPEESSAYMAASTVKEDETYLARHREFFQGLNEWFEQARKSP